MTGIPDPTTIIDERAGIQFVERNGLYRVLNRVGRTTTVSTSYARAFKAFVDSVNKAESDT